MARSFQARAGALAEVGERPRPGDALGGAGNRCTGSSCSYVDRRAPVAYRPSRSATKRKVLCREVRTLAVHGRAGEAHAEARITRPQANVERTAIFGG